MPSNAIHIACGLVLQGGVIAYPTEAVYGLGCDPRSEQAVRRILVLKERSVKKGLILVAAALSQLDAFLDEVPDTLRAAAEATWPGPYTWLWPARPGVPRWLRGEHDTLAVRVSAHPIVRALCLELDAPLVSTSANRSGQPPARTSAEVRAQFGQGVDLVVPGALGSCSEPTEIRDLRSGAVLREG